MKYIARYIVAVVLCLTATAYCAPTMTVSTSVTDVERGTVLNVILSETSFGGVADYEADPALPTGFTVPTATSSDIILGNFFTTAPSNLIVTRGNSPASLVAAMNVSPWY